MVVPPVLDKRTLYRWSGMKANPPELVSTAATALHGFFQRTMVPFADEAGLLLLGQKVEGRTAGTSNTAFFFSALVSTVE